MTAADLAREGFLQWRPFSVLLRKEILSQAPRGFGVYVFRTKVMTTLLRGRSDILYVGSACNQRGLRGRLSQYFSPGVSQSTNQRLSELIGSSSEYEVAWLEVPAKSDAVGLEQRLLERFFAEHGERPPQNLKG